MTTAAAERLREYELVFVLAPNADNTEAERINGKVSEVVSNFGGKLLKLDNWGRRKLAYPIKRHARGIFIFAKFVGKPGVVRELERNLRIADSVLRFQSNLTNPAVEGEVAVDPEDVKFTPVAPAEPEEELSFEQRLGLAPSSHRKVQVEDESDTLDSEIEEVQDLDSEPGGTPRARAERPAEGGEA